MASSTVVTQDNIVVIQLPFDFETLFTQQQVITQQSQKIPATNTGVIVSQKEREHADFSSMIADLRPRYRRSLKTKKSTQQHLDELASPHLRMAKNGRDIFCIPCSSDLTEFGKVKKSSIKLHLVCKRHIFNLKVEEHKQLSIQVPAEMKFDDISGLYQCMLCGKAISSDIHDVRRHCSGKRHVRLLENQGGFEDIPVIKALPIENATEEAAIVSAREYNNDFVYDVLDFLLRTNCQLTALGPMKRLLNKWTIMKLPTSNAIRRNHLPKYLERNPDIARKRELAAAKKVAKMRERLGETGLEEIIGGEDLMEEDMEENGIDQHGTDVNALTTTEFEQVMHAALANQDQIFTSAEIDNVLQSQAMQEESAMHHQV